MWSYVAQTHTQLLLQTIADITEGGMERLLNVYLPEWALNTFPCGKTGSLNNRTNYKIIRRFVFGI